MYQILKDNGYTDAEIELYLFFNDSSIGNMFDMELSEAL